MFNSKIKFLSIYLILAIFIIVVLWIKKENKIKNHLNYELDQVQLRYNAIYNDYRKIANVIFENKINTPEVIHIFQKANTNNISIKNETRKELYEYLKSTYTLLKKYNIKQLHFHLRNNESFLRFHRPNRFGDNLTNARKTIAYVNKNLKEIDGFEEGKIYNGYRFVYPLFNKEKKHIGSVEISFSTLAMLSSYQKAYKSFSNFILPQKIVNAKVFYDERSNYKKAHIKNFVIEKTVAAFNQDKQEYILNVKHFDNERLHTLLQQKKAFATFDHYHETFFLPVFNPIDNIMEGLFIVKQDHHYIPNKQKNFVVVSVLISILLAITLYFIFRSQQYKKTVLENNIRLRTVIEEADSGIAIMNLEGKFLDVNAMYPKLLGYTKEELLKLSCIDITYEDDKIEATTYLKNAKEKGSISKVHKICVRKDGSLINLEFSLTLLPSKENFIAVINSMEEKLKLKQLNENLQEEVQKKVKELRQKDEMILKQSKDAAMGEMIDAIAHQWKNPLGIIRMLGQSIKLEYELDTNPEIKNIIESSTKIEEQVDHLLETLEEFRSFFRPKGAVQEVTIDTLLNSVNILLKDELIKNLIQITKRGDLNSKISIYPNEFKHVLINLINNSRDAFIENDIKNRQISFHIIEQNNSVTIKMCDNAGGIPDNILSDIFEANFTTKEQDKGTGIGLYMSKQILDKIGAKITVSNENNGACFSILINK